MTIRTVNENLEVKKRNTQVYRDKLEKDVDAANKALTTETVLTLGEKPGEVVKGYKSLDGSPKTNNKTSSLAQQITPSAKSYPNLNRSNFKVSVDVLTYSVNDSSTNYTVLNIPSVQTVDSYGFLTTSISDSSTSMKSPSVTFSSRSETQTVSTVALTLTGTVPPEEDITLIAIGGGAVSAITTAIAEAAERKKSLLAQISNAAGATTQASAGLDEDYVESVENTEEELDDFTFGGGGRREKTTKSSSSKATTGTDVVSVTGTNIVNELSSTNSGIGVRTFNNNGNPWQLPLEKFAIPFKTPKIKTDGDPKWLNDQYYSYIKFDNPLFYGPASGADYTQYLFVWISRDPYGSPISGGGDRRSIFFGKLSDGLEVYWSSDADLWTGTYGNDPAKIINNVLYAGNDAGIKYLNFATVDTVGASPQQPNAFSRATKRPGENSFNSQIINASIVVNSASVNYRHPTSMIETDGQNPDDVVDNVSDISDDSAFNGDFTDVLSGVTSGMNDILTELTPDIETGFGSAQNLFEDLTGTVRDGLLSVVGVSLVLDDDLLNSVLNDTLSGNTGKAFKNLMSGNSELSPEITNIVRNTPVAEGEGVESFRSKVNTTAVSQGVPKEERDQFNESADSLETALADINTTISGQIVAQVGDFYTEDTSLADLVKRYLKADTKDFEYVDSQEELGLEFRYMVREVSELIIHATETYTNANIGAEEIHLRHNEAGHDGIQYHYVIRRDGRLQRGVPLDNPTKASDLNGHAKNCIDVVLVGGVNVPSNADDPLLNLSSSSFTQAQMKTLEKLIETFYLRHPGGQVMGHNAIDINSQDPYFDVISFVETKFGKKSVYNNPLTEVSLSPTEMAKKIPV